MLKLKKTAEVTRSVKVRLPTENPNAFNEGTITYKAKIKTKDELADLSERGYTDQEYVDELLTEVGGLGNEEGQPITGDDALREVKTGVWSVYLIGAILQDYFEQYGDARVKNSRPSRGR
ncbi:hypothetical protein [Pseudoxanthomonas sp.]|uniref:hypothetical protein n=1 Tax=Pseudoxanthomonas sp. TaxID=1871049 RepID=UPI0025CE6730|nr:hypothetical protein [Pseudoxanthomonas sp.]